MFGRKFNFFQKNRFSNIHPTKIKLFFSFKLFFLFEEKKPLFQNFWRKCWKWELVTANFANLTDISRYIEISRDISRYIAISRYISRYIEVIFDDISVDFRDISSKIKTIYRDISRYIFDISGYILKKSIYHDILRYIMMILYMDISDYIDKRYIEDDISIYYKNM